MFFLKIEHTYLYSISIFFCLKGFDGIIGKQLSSLNKFFSKFVKPAEVIYLIQVAGNFEPKEIVLFCIKI